MIDQAPTVSPKRRASPWWRTSHGGTPIPDCSISPMPMPNRTRPINSCVMRRGRRSPATGIKYLKTSTAQRLGDPRREVGACRRHEADQHMIRPQLPVSRGEVCRLGGVAGVTELDRHLDLAALPPELLARFVETSQRGDEKIRLRGEIRVVPLVCPASCQRNVPTGTRATDDERRAGLLHRLWLKARRGDGPILPLEVEHLLGHQPVQDLERLFEHVEALPDRWEVDVEGLMLTLVPTGADSQFESPLRHAIQGHCLLGQEDGMPKCVGGQHRSEPDPGGDRGQATEEGPAVHDRPRLFAPRRVEMIVQPDGVPEAAPVGLDPHLTQLGPVLILGPYLERMPEWAHGHGVPGWTTRGTSGRSSAGSNPNTLP